MNRFDVRHRAAAVAAIQAETFDLVVIGGGITGAGILREASLRGLKVALLEGQDFGAGTSSKSTKLIHGGIRYLQELQFHVVREAAIERKRVNQLAPHLATPHWLTLPAQSTFSFAKYSVGVAIYELLGQVAQSDRHFSLQGQALADWEPLLSGVPRAVVYREYLTDDARLVLGNIRAGVNAGGQALNYAAVTGLRRVGGKTEGVEARCAITGESFLVRGKCVINAAGPWVESICQLDETQNHKSLVLSKGVHISVPHEKLPIRQMTLMEHTDGRPVFAIPRGDVVYIGTTDTRYDQPDLWPEVLGSEVDYLCDPVRDYFGVSLTRDDCVSTWAGLRPLISDGSKRTTQISRRDEIWVSQSGLVTIAGGKLTGYRKMAEDTVNKAASLFALNARTSAGDEPLPGGDIAGTLDEYTTSLSGQFNLDAETLQRMVQLYGSETPEVLSLGQASVGGDSRVLDGEIRWAIAREGVCHLEDFVYRRSRNVLFSPAGFEQTLAPIGEEMATLMKWSQEDLRNELVRVKARWRDDLAFLNRSNDVDDELPSAAAVNS